MKNKKYHTVGTVLKYNSKILERGKINTLLGTDTSIDSGRVKFVLKVKTSHISEMMRSYKCFPHVTNPHI